MGEFEFTKRVIDRHEEMVTKEIERCISGNGRICPTALYERLFECVNARRELNYEPIAESVEELLSLYNYEQDFIERFGSQAKEHAPKDCPEL